MPFDYWFDYQSLDQQRGVHPSMILFHSGQLPAWNCFLHSISWDVSFCITPTATALSQDPSTAFTRSENIYPLPARSAQLICQGFKLAFPHLSYLLQIYQQDTFSDYSLCSKPYSGEWKITKFTGLVVHKAFSLSHKGFRTNNKYLLNWAYGIWTKENFRNQDEGRSVFS